MCLGEMTYSNAERVYAQDAHDGKRSRAFEGGVMPILSDEAIVSRRLQLSKHALVARRRKPRGFACVLVHDRRAATGLAGVADQYVQTCDPAGACRRESRCWHDPKQDRRRSKNRQSVRSSLQMNAGILRPRRIHWRVFVGQSPAHDPGRQSGVSACATIRGERLHTVMA